MVRFSIPSIIGMAVHALYNVVDRIFIGQGVGTQGIAGLTIVFPVMLISLALNMLVGLGAGAVISIRLGEGKKDEAERVLGNAVVVVVVLFALVTASGYLFLKPLLVLFGASQEILPVSEAYLRIVLLMFIPGGLGFVLNATVRSEGNPKIAMYTMLIGGVLNMLLDPLFIFVFKWGVEGAAIATVISSLVSTSWLLFYYLSGKSVLKIRIRNFTLNPSTVGSILAIGFAPCAMQLGGSVMVTLLNHQLGIYGGDLALSVMGVIFSINFIIMVPAIGIAQGGQPIIGFNYGARKFERVKRTLNYAMVAATIVSTLGFCLIMFFPRQVFTSFNSSDLAFIGLGTSLIRISSLFLPVVGFQIIGANFFQAVGKAKKSALLSLSRQVLLLLPALLILPLFFGLKGVVAAMPFADAGSALITGAFIYHELKQYR